MHSGNTATHDHVVNLESNASLSKGAFGWTELVIPCVLLAFAMSGEWDGLFEDSKSL